MPTPRVIDLSHHQTIPVDLFATAQSGIIGVIHKCTEGLNYTDPKVGSRYYLASHAALVWGLYHFLRPGSMEGQVDFFLQEARPFMNDNTLLAADHEDPGVSLADLAQFLEMLQERSGRVPVLYSGHVLKEQLAHSQAIDLTKYRLWLAQYTSGNKKPDLPAGFTSWWMWQYTDGATVAGIDPPTDVSAISASTGDFLQQWSGRLPAPLPEPGPAPVPSATVEERLTALETRVSALEAIPVKHS